MSLSWTRMTLCALLLLAGAASLVRADEIGAGADSLCGKDQLSGQYECVRLIPLSEEEAWVSMAYFASLRSLYAPVRGSGLPRIASVRISPEYQSAVNSVSYHVETCSGDYVCGEDGAWATH